MSSNAGTISPQPQCSLEATVTTANAAQYLSLFRKYMFHRDYILEHCSPGLVPVWREVLTMMKVVVYLSEQRGSIQLFLIKDINAFLLDNETMPLDKDVFSSPASPTSPTAAAAAATASSVSASPSTTPEPNKQQQYPIRASKSFQTITKSFKNSFRNRSASSPAFASDEFSFTPPSPTLNQGVLSPATPGSLLSSSSPTPGSHARLGPSPLATSPPSTPSSLGDEAADDHTHSHSHQSQHHRSNSSGSLISKIFKSRSFDFKSVREPNADTRAVEERIEKAIAECVTDDDLNEPEPLETDRLSPLPKGSLARRKRSVSVSGGKAPEDLTSGNISPLPPIVQQPESPVPRLRRCSSVRFSSPPAGMKRSPSATSQNSLASAFSPPASATKTLLDLFSMGKEDELERSNSDESFSLFGPKPTEKDLAKEHMIKSSYRYHMRRRAVCLFHNEDIEANIEDPPRPSRSS